MQIKDNYLNHTSSLWLWIKIAIAVLALFFVYEQFEAEHIDFWSVAWPINSVLVMAVVFSLMMINWSLEAIRWKASISVFEGVSFIDSLKSVLGGIALNWILPFTTGDALYRLAERQDKYKTAAAILINRGIMLLITLAYGLTSVWYYTNSLIDFNFLVLFVPLIGIIVVWQLRKRINRFLTYFKQIGMSELLFVLGVSVLRYVIFVFQFFLLLNLFLPELSIETLLLGIGWVFFFKSVLPSVFGGVGIREASGLVFFSSVSDPSLVVIPIFLIWLINSAIPSLCGLIAIWSFRFKSDR